MNTILIRVWFASNHWSLSDTVKITRVIIKTRRRSGNCYLPIITYGRQSIGYTWYWNRASIITVSANAVSLELVIDSAKKYINMYSSQVRWELSNKQILFLILTILVYFDTSTSTVYRLAGTTVFVVEHDERFEYFEEHG